MDKKQQAIQMDEEGFCLICKEKKATRSRGLCQKHYHQFRREKLTLPKSKQDDYERVLIELGCLLEPKKPWESTVEKSIFEQVSEQFKEAPKPSLEAESAAQIEELKKKQAKRTKKVTRKKNGDSDDGKKSGTG